MNENSETNYVSRLQVDEFIGVCRGISSNGSICKDEAALLYDWLSENRSLASRWPYNELQDKLRMMIQHDELTKDNEKTLNRILQDLMSVHCN